MISCIIVEDEKAGQAILSKKLQTFYPEVAIKKIIDNKDEALSFFKADTVDIVFLDVHLKGGNGIDVLKTIKNENIQVIIVSAYEQYGIEALNNGADYYILKPISNAEFKKCMDYTLKRCDSEHDEHSLLVSTSGVQVLLQIKDIIYIKSEGSYSFIYTENESYVSTKNLGYYEQVLPEMSFARPHHSYIVNGLKIKNFTKTRNGTLTMSNNDTVPVSQRKMNEFLNFLKVIES